MKLRAPSQLIIIGLAFLSFISLGLPDGLMGVAWPSIRAYFKLPLDALSSMLVMFTLGFLITSFNSGKLLSHINVGLLLGIGCSLTAISLLAYAFAPVWMMMVAFAFVLGIGAALIDSGLNIYAAKNFTARVVNWLHACYGIGATLGPTIMVGVFKLGYPWQRAYILVGVGQLLLVICFISSFKLWNSSQSIIVEVEPVENNSQNRSQNIRITTRETLSKPIVWFSMIVFFIYTGIEATAGAWVFSLFTEARSIPANIAGIWVSIYWGALTMGRLISGLIAHRIAHQKMIRATMIGIALSAALIWSNLSPIVSFLALALMGLLCAPIFPTLISTTPERLGRDHVANGIGFQIAAAVSGQSLIPSLIGFLANKISLEIIGPALLTAAILLFFFVEILLSGKFKIDKANYRSLPSYEHS